MGARGIGRSGEVSSAIPRASPIGSRTPRWVSWLVATSRRRQCEQDRVLSDRRSRGSRNACSKICPSSPEMEWPLLYNRFVFSGPQTAAILLAELTSIRFLRDETASGFCMRLVELLEELETVPGSAAVCMNDTQKLGYLLSAIIHETDLQSVYVQLQADQLSGNVTFEQACDELHHRCDAIRADKYMDTTFHGGLKALVSTELKKIDKLKQNTSRLNCLTKDCFGMIVAFLLFVSPATCSALLAKSSRWYCETI
jgi:hypothetical protein